MREPELPRSAGSEFEVRNKSKRRSKRTSLASKIRKQCKLFEARKARADHQLKELQGKCPHPNKEESFNSDSGKSLIVCPDCHKSFGEKPGTIEYFQ